jgi:hypothetical protein
MKGSVTKERAIGLVRVSGRDDDSGHSPELQVRAMLKYTCDQGYLPSADDVLDELPADR